MAAFGRINKYSHYDRSIQLQGDNQCQSKHQAKTRLNQFAELCRSNSSSQSQLLMQTRFEAEGRCCEPEKYREGFFDSFALRSRYKSCGVFHLKQLLEIGGPASRSVIFIVGGIYLNQEPTGRILEICNGSGQRPDVIRPPRLRKSCSRQVLDDSFPTTELLVPAELDRACTDESGHHPELCVRQ